MNPFNVLLLLLLGFMAGTATLNAGASLCDAQAAAAMMVVGFSLFIPTNH